MATAFRFLEDFRIGLEGVTTGRTIGETATDTFGYVTGDYSPQHMDRHASAKTPFGERVSHGLLASCLVPGMISLDSPHVVGAGVPDALLRRFEVSYRRAILVGDSIRIRWRVAATADDPQCDGYGLVSTGFEVLNQDAVAVYDGTIALAVRKKSGEHAPPGFPTGTLWEIDPFVLNPTKEYRFEDYVVGQGEESGGRTMTEADVVNFVGLTGELNPLYVDADFAKESIFGARIVPPMFVFSAMTNLVNRHGAMIKAQTSSSADSWAGHLGDGVTFLRPVSIGDTLRCRCRIQSARPSQSKPHVGIITMGMQIVNQRKEVVQEGYVAHTCGRRQSGA